MPNTLALYCSSCGGFLGQVVPGYAHAVECFCGETTQVKEPAQDTTESV